jgi:WD40 repeat protein/tRNA A-37 threonylcarbamoyl transferase component Bud32
MCGSVEQTILVDKPQSTSSFHAPPFHAPTPLPRPIVDGYEILEELGAGGMGVVYKARQIDRDRLVALKVIRHERLNNADVVNRFRREAQAAARLSHPNVVAVYESDRVGDTHFLAMEYVPGVTLQKLVEQVGPLPVSKACDFVRQVAIGLQHASEQALVHRDIKPANVMVVVPMGELMPFRPVVKILDMGVARLYHLAHSPEESLTTLTRDGAVIGTPDFIAPEQLEDPHGADIRADLYSLGCTFYYLLTGVVPFPGGTLISKLDRQRRDMPPSVEQLRPDVPAAVVAVVRRLMAKKPTERYRTPGELAAALDHLERTGVLPDGHQPDPLREQRSIAAHTGAVTGVAFALDGDKIVSGGVDRIIHVWDAATGKQLNRHVTGAPEVAALLVVPRTGHILAAHGIGVRLWEMATGRELLRLSGHSDAVRALAVSRDGKLALTGSDDRTARVWDVTTGREAMRFTGHKGRVTGVALAPDTRWAVSGDREQTLRLWEAKTGKQIRTFAVPKGAVLAVGVTPDGKRILTAHFDTTLRLWDHDDGRELLRFTGHKQMVSCLAISADGSRFASGSNDGSVRIWDPRSGAELWCCQGHAGAVQSVAFSPDGKRLVSGGADGTVRLWALPV